MSITKISDELLVAEKRYHECQKDVPGISADEMKRFFDYLPRRVIIPKVNELCDEADSVRYEFDNYYTKEEADELFAKASDSPDTGDAATAADSIVSCGVDGGWTFRMYDSGVCECSKRIDVSTSMMNDLSEYTFYRSQVMSEYLPEGMFTSVGAVTLDAVTEDTDVIYFVRAVNVSPVSVNYYIAKPVEGGDFNGSISITVKGSWR